MVTNAAKYKFDLEVFLEGSNDKVSIPETASFWDKKFIVVSSS